MLVRLKMYYEGDRKDIKDNDDSRYHTFIGKTESCGERDERTIDDIIRCANAVAMEISKGKGKWRLDDISNYPVNTSILA